MCILCLSVQRAFTLHTFPLRQRVAMPPCICRFRLSLMLNLHPFPRLHSFVGKHVSAFSISQQCSMSVAPLALHKIHAESKRSSWQITRNILLPGNESSNPEQVAPELAGQGSRQPTPSPEDRNAESGTSGMWLREALWSHAGITNQGTAPGTSLPPDAQPLPRVRRRKPDKRMRISMEQPSREPSTSL